MSPSRESAVRSGLHGRKAMSACGAQTARNAGTHPPAAAIALSNHGFLKELVR